MHPSKKKVRRESCGGGAVLEIVPDGFDDAPLNFVITRTCSRGTRKTGATRIDYYLRLDIVKPELLLSTRGPDHDAMIHHRSNDVVQDIAGTLNPNQLQLAAFSRNNLKPVLIKM